MALAFEAGEHWVPWTYGVAATLTVVFWFVFSLSASVLRSTEWRSIFRVPDLRLLVCHSAPGLTALCAGTGLRSRDRCLLIRSRGDGNSRLSSVAASRPRTHGMPRAPFPASPSSPSAPLVCSPLSWRNSRHSRPGVLPVSVFLEVLIPLHLPRPSDHSKGRSHHGPSASCLHRDGLCGLYPPASVYLSASPPASLPLPGHSLRSPEHGRGTVGVLDGAVPPGVVPASALRRFSIPDPKLPNARSSPPLTAISENTASFPEALWEPQSL